MSLWRISSCGHARLGEHRGEGVPQAVDIHGAAICVGLLDPCRHQVPVEYPDQVPRHVEELRVARQCHRHVGPPVPQRLPAVLSELLVQVFAQVPHEVGPQRNHRALAALGVLGRQFGVRPLIIEVQAPRQKN